MKLLSARAEHLAVLRVVVFSIWLISIATSDTALYPALPDGLLQPHGVGRFLGIEFVLGSPLLWQALWWAAVAGCALCVLGVRPFGPFAGATALLVLYYDTAMKSLGSYVNHAQVVPLLLVLLLPLFPASDAFSLFRRRRPIPPASVWLYRAPAVAAGLILALSYSFIGARRIFLGGVGVYADGSMLQWIVARTRQYGALDVSVGLDLVGQPWVGPVLGVALLVTTAFEILSPLAIRYRRFRPVWVTVIAGFHLATLALMNIFFWENLILLVVLFTPVGEWMTNLFRADAGSESATRQKVSVSP